MNAVAIGSIEEFVRSIGRDRDGWSHAWFRGEPKVDSPLTPKLYRPRPDRSQHHENKLLQLFRMKAPTFSAHPCPDRDNTDQWLFLAQHVGLPTRLLDWTESALVALHFALLEDEKKRPPVVWMLNPVELNRRSVSDKAKLSGDDEFPLTWHDPGGGWINIGLINIRGAWEKDGPGVDLPVAVQPTNIHPRMSVQRSCFTVQGKDKRSLAVQVPELLRCYEIDLEVRSRVLDDLRLLGISHSTVFPDLDGLAKELTELY